jgi:GNAT superfamily N-acetyltransferase
MNIKRDDYLVSTNEQLLDVGFICRGLNRTYWAEHRTRATVEESIKNSLCFGVYRKEPFEQVGFARVVTDKVTFSWICDVFIEEDSRGSGLGKWLMRCVTDHPIVKSTLNILGTRDAHGLYEKYGFVRYEMMRRGAIKLEANHVIDPAEISATPAADTPSGLSSHSADS